MITDHLTNTVFLSDWLGLSDFEQHQRHLVSRLHAHPNG